jgi:hypothetical protein
MGMKKVQPRDYLLGITYEAMAFKSSVEGMGMVEGKSKASAVFTNASR